MPQTDEAAYWNTSWKRGLRDVNRFAVRAAGLLGDPPKRVLDLGCGTGKDSLYLAGRGHRVTAMDFSESAITWLREQAAERRLPVTAVIGDIGSALPFRAAAFDAVYAHLSLHYFPDAQTRAVFREVLRVLRPGGLFFVKCKSVDDPLYGKGKKVGEDMYVRGHVRHFFRREFMAEMLEPFTVLRLRRSSSAYRGQESAFIEALARKA